MTKSVEKPGAAWRVVVLLASLTWSSAHALPVGTSLSFTLVTTDMSGRLIATPSFATANGPTRDPLEVVGGFPAGASGSGSADFGALGAIAASSAFDSNNSASTGFAPSNSTAAAHTAATWTDLLIGTSTVFAPGTHVHALATIGFEGITNIAAGTVDPTALGGAVALDGWQIAAGLDNLSTGFLGGICAEGGVLVLVCPNLLPPNVPFASQTSFMVDLVIGENTELLGTLDVGAASQVFTQLSGQVASASAVFDALHTAHFYLDPVEDFRIVSASGHDYSSPLAPPPPPPASVPEPTTMALLLAVLGGVALRRAASTRMARTK